MPLGEAGYSNRNKEKNYSDPNTYVSGYRFGNIDSKIDQTQLSFQLWKQNLKVLISPRTQGTTTNSSGFVEYDIRNSATFFLSPTKARIMYEEICKFQSDPDLYNNVGVPGGITSNTVLVLNNGKEYNTKNHCLIIYLLNPTDGAPINNYVYEFNKGYHYSIRNFSKDTYDNKYIKVTDEYDGLELEMFKTVLKEFYTGSTMIIAHTVLSAEYKGYTQTENILLNMCEKLGVNPNNKPGRQQSLSGSKSSDVLVPLSGNIDDYL